MKKTVASLSLLCATGLSWAEGAAGPTIYGLLDVGLDRVSNVGGKGMSLVNSGVLVPNLIGIRGGEDLGGGLKVIYKLESQFALDTGATIGINGTESGFFNHGAYVGLQGPQGTVTAGALDDFMFSNLSVKRYGMGAMFPFVSLPFLRQGPFAALTPVGSFDFDRTGLTSRITNAVRYDSPDINGFNFGGVYGMGEQSGSTSKNSTWSVGADYSTGPLTLTFAAINSKSPLINDGNDGLTSWGLGGRYDFSGGVSTDFLYTNTKNTFTNAKIDVIEFGGIMAPTEKTRLIGQYTYMKGNEQLSNNKASQFNVGLHYLLSKRSNVYVAYAFQHASGDGDDAKAQLMLAGGASSGSTQGVLRVGIFHAF
jgi:predicted porin